MRTSTLLGTFLAICDIVSGIVLEADLISRSTENTQPQTSAEANQLTKNLGCIALTIASWKNVFYPGSDVYQYENQEFWSLTEVLSPSCVFRPSNAEQVGLAVRVLEATNTKFAVRGGGHMGIKVCCLPMFSALGLITSSTFHAERCWTGRK